MQEQNLLTSLLPLVAIFAIFYFLVIRPQQKQQKQHAEMISNLVKGDKIITNGGLICEVIKPEEDFIKVKLNDDVIVRLSRDFVAKKIEA
ncbi:preprotein translocase subunit YajC [Campylobacter pinnipediorum]|uniref:Sec translocon accessory complex subunit YajC n=1 Tax=Campylobacter pinnipediorum subsp. pinnipediorum TaxID=1660067 RepID=A0AAX0LCE6_9BACT|nr:preprotein translocase subunit YajC [Campylobacter pinnipediorum]AQW82039.1 preprotein translocase subunit YajC [Campylobacter pinnipediorum subsp. pinnipediorum]AQW83717.1 preprotein translocase subunit YajC [Campylobacter pinnipediorum subsp. pinnipediorum]AQW85236.1 preprotein translocase subunit YajC [Campylobacter pinnipediorum subsp. pinnipediorum]OPA71047.1 preprotein translocase subunit YajC [Campylobacter pinnipediorum subsp. caledonicus]OPA74403.1 preprotein translocase subunit Ya